MNAPLTAAAFRARIKKEPSGGYLFYGDEAYTKAHALKELRSAVLPGGDDDAFNHIRLDARDEGQTNIADAIESLPVFAERKLVELHGFDTAHMKKEEFESFLECFSLLADNPHTVLVMVTTPFELDPGTAKKPSKELAELSSRLTPVNFERESRAALERWIVKHFAHEKLDCEAGAAGLLIGHVGNDMYTLSAEIEKLCAYVGARGGASVTAADIDSVAARNVSIAAFDFSDALTSSDAPRALCILEDMRARDEKPEIVMGQIASTYTLLTRLKAIADDGGGSGRASQELKIHEYRAQLYMNRLVDFSAKRLFRAVALCAEADIKMKTGGLDRYVVLSRLLCELLAVRGG